MLLYTGLASAIGQASYQTSGACNDQEEEQQQKAYQNGAEHAGGNDADGKQNDSQGNCADYAYQKGIQRCAKTAAASVSAGQSGGQHQYAQIGDSHAQGYPQENRGNSDGAGDLQECGYNAGDNADDDSYNGASALTITTKN